MSKTIFKTVNYALGNLVNHIAMGQIGLPDIQRPFVWKNAKVRDLFDSMYRGYPVGYLLLWQNGQSESSKQIGVDEKQLTSQLVIVDGQQRLTSLYAVVKGVEVVRNNMTKERIRIAFNPLEEKFEVTDAAIERDSAFIPDISLLWEPDVDLFDLVDSYLEKLASAREVSIEETKATRRSIVSLQGLMDYPFTALQLDAEISVEDVSDVFVRINSKGKTLNQADFILTLMSVFWDEGRTELESFCRDSRTPGAGGPSPFNYFLSPTPDQLLRVCVGLGFKRARLQYVYSILRGKNLESGEFSDDRREEQFDILKSAQERVLNVQYWHDFMRCIHLAGFRSSAMITSNNNLLFAYILYLIGRTEFKVEENSLRKLIARWFFMSSVTGRFSKSPEGAMEYDLSRLRDVSTAGEFATNLSQICDVAVTNDFWDVTLPNSLATSSSRSPALFAYNAALVLLDATALYSNVKISDLVDPALHGTKSAVERHHLFPKGYLSTLQISSTIHTNQIANYAYVEYLDNISISDHAPQEYVPELCKRFSEQELALMYHHHALSEQWEKQEYQTFLQDRREKIGSIVREGYLRLVGDTPASTGTKKVDIFELVERGESEAIEFKSTLRVNLHTGQRDKKMEFAIVKTIAGFLNNGGGTLVIGIADDGTPVGLDVDQFENEDKMTLHLVNLVKTRLGANALTHLHFHFDDYKGARVFAVKVPRSSVPVCMKDGDVERFYVRTGPSTTELQASDTHVFIKKRFN